MSDKHNAWKSKDMLESLVREAVDAPGELIINAAKESPHVSKRARRAVKVISRAPGVAYDVLSLATADNKTREAFGLAGGLIGGAGGAAMGSVAGPAGTFVGGTAGSVAGEQVGKEIYDRNKKVIDRTVNRIGRAASETWRGLGTMPEWLEAREREIARKAALAMRPHWPIDDIYRAQGR